MTTATDSQAQLRSRLDNSILGVALVALALTAVVAVVWLLWLEAAPPLSLSFEHYFPAVNGASLSYRQINPDGSVTYLSRNVSRDRANTQSGSLPLNVFTALMKTAGLNLEQMEAAELLDQLSAMQLVRLNDVESDPQGNPVNRTTTYALLVNQGIQQFGVNDIGIAPPIPLLPLGDTPQTIQGKLNDAIPFRMTQQIESRGAYRTAIGEFPDCIRVKSELVLNENTTTNLTWYCAGIGQVADEMTDTNGTRRTEIVAASVDKLILGNTPIAGDRNLNASIQRVFDEPLPGMAIRLFDYQEATASLGITTNILPVEGNLLYGTASGAIVLLDRAANQGLWRFQSGDAVFSTPVVANGLVFFGSTDKKIYALRLQDGAFVWSYPTRDVVSASPAVYGDTVYVASEDRHLYALDADTGRLRWSFSTGGAFVAPPVIADDTLFVSNDDGGLFALDPTTGRVRWEFSAGRAVTAPVTPHDGVLYFGSFDNTVFALDQTNGHMLWSRDVGDSVKQPVIAANGRVYVTLDQEVFALDAATGDPLWYYDNVRPLLGAPVLLGNQLWLAGTGNLISLDANTGALTYEVPTTESTAESGVSSDGRELYLGYFDGALYGFARANP